MAITHEEEPGLLSLRHGELPAPNKSVLQMAARDEQEKEVGVSREREAENKGVAFFIPPMPRWEAFPSKTPRQATSHFQLNFFLLSWHFLPPLLYLPQLLDLLRASPGKSLSQFTPLEQLSLLKSCPVSLL